MFSNINEVWNNDTVKETTNKLLNKIPKRENTDNSLYSLDERNISDLFKDKCENSINHIKSCNKCFNKFNNLIDIKVNKKFNDFLKKKDKTFSFNQVILIIIGVIFFILIIILLIKLFFLSNL